MKSVSWKEKQKKNLKTRNNVQERSLDERIHSHSHITFFVEETYKIKRKVQVGRG
jgi:hypothetical protein